MASPSSGRQLNIPSPSKEGGGLGWGFPRIELKAEPIETPIPTFPLLRGGRSYWNEPAVHFVTMLIAKFIPREHVFHPLPFERRGRVRVGVPKDRFSVTPISNSIRTY
jgi:hypothetical protein